MALIFLIFALFYQSCKDSNSKSTYIYLVRHADKGGKDSLSLEGVNRANQLLHLLGNAEIGTIYSTNYKRTKDTAMPLANAIQKEIEIYNPQNLEALASSIRTKHTGQRILVVGHSNTTPTLVNLLYNKEQIDQINESEYDKLYLVILNPCCENELIEMEYGVISPKLE